MNLLLIEVLMLMTLAYVGLMIFSISWFTFGIYLVWQGLTNRKA